MSASTKMIKSCRLCGNARLIPVCDLGSLAFTGIFPKTQNEVVPRGPLELVKCHNPEGRSCGLVQLRHSFDKNILFGKTYGYRSGLNPTMRSHLQDLAFSILKRKKLVPGDVVIDIGSSDSTLLRSFCGRNLYLLGVDPLADRFRRYYPREIRRDPHFFNGPSVAKKLKGRKAKIITAIAMLYDLDDPLAFLKEAHALLHPEGLLVLEQGYLPSLLKNTAYDNICHEHATYYGFKQLHLLAARAGFKIIDAELNDTNGGSFCVYLTRDDSADPETARRIRRLVRDENKMRLDSFDIYDDFRKNILAHRRALRHAIHRLRKRNRLIAVYGASTKGNVLLQYCGLTSREIAFAAEINKDKWGSCCPGTKIPIISEEAAKDQKPDVFLVLPWHFKDAILAKEKNYINQGGRLLFPWPKIDVVDAQNVSFQKSFCGKSRR